MCIFYCTDDRDYLFSDCAFSNIDTRWILNATISFNNSINISDFQSCIITYVKKW